MNLLSSDSACKSLWLLVIDDRFRFARANEYPIGYDRNGVAMSDRSVVARRKSRRMTCAALALSAIAVFGASTAAAAAEAPVPGDPYGCDMYVLNPHLSESSMGSVHGGIKSCSSVPGERFVSLTLQKQGWAGWHNMTTNTAFRSLGSLSNLDANARFVCSNFSSQNYRGEMSVRVSGSNAGPHYYGSLRGSEARFGCDRP